eukprot:2124766-Prymnesium_polylepis.1
MRAPARARNAPAQQSQPAPRRPRYRSPACWPLTSSSCSWQSLQISSSIRSADRVAHESLR